MGERVETRTGSPALNIAFSFRANTTPEGDPADLPEPREAPRVQTHGVYESISLSLDGEVDGDRFAEFIESELAPSLITLSAELRAMPADNLSSRASPHAADARAASPISAVDMTRRVGR